MPNLDPLEEEIKGLIIKTLRLEDMSPADIDAEASLFGQGEEKGLELDSIDALELGVALQKRYQIRFDSNISETRRHFASVRSLAAFVGRTRK